MLEQPIRAEKDEGQKEKSNKAHKEGAVLNVCHCMLLLLESIWYRTSDHREVLLPPADGKKTLCVIQ